MRLRALEEQGARRGERRSILATQQGPDECGGRDLPCLPVAERGTGADPLLKSRVRDGWALHWISIVVHPVLILYCHEE